MRWILATKYFEKYYDESSRPKPRTMARRCQQLHKQGMAKREGRAWYIDEHKLLAQGDPLVEQVLAG